MSEYAVCFLVAALVSVFTVYPLFVRSAQAGRDAGEDSRDGRLGLLRERRELYYSSIREIELDRDMGKLSERDYSELTSRYKRKAAEISKRISELESAGESGFVSAKTP